jgi:hypothetical protein
MAFLTACRKARAWQRQLQALASINSLQFYSTSSAIAWAHPERFYSTASSPLGVAADVQPASDIPPGRKRVSYKRHKLDENELLDAAKRIFDMTVGTEKDFIDGDAVEAEADANIDSEQPDQPPISSELLEEHRDILTAIDKKRERTPLFVGEVRLNYNICSFIHCCRPRNGYKLINY